MEPWPSRSLTICRSAPPAKLVESNVPTLLNRSARRTGLLHGPAKISVVADHNSGFGIASENVNQQMRRHVHIAALFLPRGDARHERSVRQCHPVALDHDRPGRVNDHRTARARRTARTGLHGLYSKWTLNDLGAGWDRPEFEFLDLPFPSAAERSDRLEAVLRACRTTWGEAAAGPPTFGQSATASRPLLLVGGEGEKRTLPAAVAYADLSTGRSA
jgi:hypothetical protein